MYIIITIFKTNWRVTSMYKYVHTHVQAYTYKGCQKAFGHAWFYVKTTVNRPPYISLHRRLCLIKLAEPKTEVDKKL